MVVRTPNSVGVVVSRQLPPPQPALPIANHQPRHMRRAVIGRSQIEREWLCHVSPPCVRGFLGGGVDWEGRNTLFLVEG